MLQSRNGSKSTNDRSLPPVPAPIRMGFRALSRVWPEKAEDWGSWLFCHPKRARVAATDREILRTGHRFTLEVEGFRLAAWSWGDGPTVILHHGWGGRASQMTAFVPELLRAGFGVLAYDAPAHGESPGHITAGPEMARILRAVDRRMMGIHGVIAHSVGGAATLLAIGDGFDPQRVVLLAAPSDLRGFVEVFAEHMGMDWRRVPGIGDRAAARFGVEWQKMHIGHWSRASHPPLRIFHDRGDDVLDLESGRAIQREWDNAELVVTEGLGHRRIRRDPEVVESAVSFLAGDSSTDHVE